MSECIERRGRCASFITAKQLRKKVRQDIEMLNKKKATAADPERAD